mgnify:CR=1 FL=1
MRVGNTGYSQEPQGIVEAFADSHDLFIPLSTAMILKLSNDILYYSIPSVIRTIRTSNNEHSLWHQLTP